MNATMTRIGDGQAITSSLRRTPGVKREPTADDVFRGVLDWQQQDPTRHRAMFDLVGHRIVLHAQILGVDRVPTIIFTRFFSPGFVVETIETVIQLKLATLTVNSVSDVVNLIRPDLDLATLDGGD